MKWIGRIALVLAFTSLAALAALPGARLLLGEDASAEAFEDLSGRARIVHLATHGHFREDNPLFSAIQLADSRLPRA